MALWMRRVRVDVAGVRISELRVAFSLRRTVTQEADGGTIRIYGMAPGTEDRIAEAGGDIEIHAGYADQGLSLMWSGPVRRVYRMRTLGARETLIESYAQDPGLAQVGPVAYAGRRSVRHIVADIASQTRIVLGPLDAIPSDARETDWSWSGTRGAGLSELLRDRGITWYVDDGILRFDASGELQRDHAEHRIKPSNGLVATPITTDRGIEVTSLLRPAIRCGDEVYVDSADTAGAWKVAAVQHYGDSWRAGGKFHTRLDLRRIDFGGLRSIAPRLRTA